MAISLGSIKRKKADGPPRLMLYGVAGTGKTSAAASFPRPVFLQIEDGTPAGIEIEGWDIASYADVLEAIGELANGEHEFQTVVVDTVDGLEKIVWKEACARGGWATIEDAGFGKGYVAAADVWGEILDGLNALSRHRGMMVVIIGHCEINRFDSPTTDPYSRYRVNLHKRAADLIEAAVDVIGFINYRATIKKVDTGFNKTATHAEGGGQRIIYTEERPGFIAKNRYDMPPEIPFKKGEAYTALSRYFPGIAEPEKLAA